MDKVIKFVLIDDSALMRRVISDIIRVGYKNALVTMAIDGLDGYNLLIQNQKPDLVILDINMPVMSGLELLEKLKEIGYEVPILMVSTLALEGAAETIQALELGAIDFVTKPGSIAQAKEMVFSEKLLTKIDIILNQYKSVVSIPFVANLETPQEVTYHKNSLSSGSKLIALCCSTGGPKALHYIIPKLKKGLDAPMLLVQHMPAGFTKSLANRLNEISEVEVKEAVHGEVLKKGVVYIAKGGLHMQLEQKGNEYKIQINELPPREGLRPSANIMYESLFNTRFDEITCVVLTGMGADGTVGIKKLKTNKKLHIIAQDSQSSVVYGMPKAIFETGLVDEVVSLEKIADTIMRKVGVQ